MNARTALYRHYDSTGILLYVGISLSAINRLLQHQRSSVWVAEAVRMETQWFDTRTEAEAAERLAIHAENPKFNIVHTKPAKLQYKVKSVITKTVLNDADNEWKPSQESIRFNNRILEKKREVNKEHKMWLEKINCSDDPSNADYICIDEYKKYCGMGNFIGPLKLKNNPPSCRLCGGKSVFDDSLE